MPHLTKYILPGGESIAIETDEPEFIGAQPVGIGDYVADSTKKIRESLHQLPEFVKSLKDHMAEQLSDATSISIEFGAKISADVGFIIAKSQVEANFKITVSWEK